MVLGENYIALALKLVKNSCECYDKYQTLKKQCELLANSLSNSMLGITQLLSHLSDCRFFALHLDETNYAEANLFLALQ